MPITPQPAPVAIIHPADHPEWSATEYACHRALRLVILKAHLDGVQKAALAGVLQRTLREMGFQASVKP